MQYQDPDIAVVKLVESRFCLRTQILLDLSRRSPSLAQ